MASKAGSFLVAFHNGAGPCFVPWSAMMWPSRPAFDPVARIPECRRDALRHPLHPV